MRGRTNVLGGGDGLNLGAEVENFVVADGSNIVAGNFVQYKTEQNNQKYDGNGFYEYYFYSSGNGSSKVAPLGNDRYILWYSNNSSGNPYFMSLVDVGNGFNILSTISISNDAFPDFCVLNDGNLAVGYVEAKYGLAIKIYSANNAFSQISIYNAEMPDDVGKVYRKGAHIVQISDSRILISSGNDAFICTYLNGNITDCAYINLGIPCLGFSYWNEIIVDPTSWSMYAASNNHVILFPLFEDNKTSLGYSKQVTLIKIDGESVNIVSNERIGKARTNRALFGNAFGINGKVLFSDGDIGIDIAVKEYYKTRIYYQSEGELAQSQVINLLDESKETFSDLDQTVITDPYTDNSSGTAQYVKEDVFYAAVLPGHSYRDDIRNPKNRVAIFRVTYNPQTGMFSRSNIVTIEGDESGSHAGYGKFFESENGDVYYLYETSLSGTGKVGRWLLRMTYKNGILTKGENTRYVENYSGSAAIGVAKESGKSGQTIEVYVPTPV